MRLIFFGPPGVGKGTQAERLADRVGVPHISTGAIFRAAMQAETPLGNEVKGFYDRGALVPDELTTAIVVEALADDALEALERHALHVELEAAKAAELFATTGTPRATVDRVGKHQAGRGCLARDLVRTTPDPAVPRTDAENDGLGPIRVIGVDARDQATTAAVGEPDRLVG